MSTLRTQVIRVAHSFPPGSKEREALLHVLKQGSTTSVQLKRVFPTYLVAKTVTPHSDIIEVAGDINFLGKNYPVAYVIDRVDGGVPDWTIQGTKDDLVEYILLVIVEAVGRQIWKKLKPGKYRFDLPLNFDCEFQEARPGAPNLSIKNLTFVFGVVGVVQSLYSFRLLVTADKKAHSVRLYGPPEVQAMMDQVISLIPVQKILNDLNP